LGATEEAGEYFEQGNEAITIVMESEELVDYLPYRWGQQIWKNMIHISSELILYPNGAFETNSILKDDSRHRKYENTLTFNLRFKDSNNLLCNISSVSGNISPGEQKPYSTSGQNNECIKNNFALLKSGVVVANFEWSCAER